MAAKERISFLHPDLGLGGAERLIVDAAVGLQQKGFDVVVYTGYHDKNRAFPETVDGTLKVVALGGWIPRSVFGKFVALCSYMKMTYIAMYLNILNLLRWKTPDVIICDQVSACIPFLKLASFFSRSKILFYCHFPDQLLATGRESFIKRLYRKPLDWFEEFTTRLADKIVVNSQFTRGVFKETFKSIKSTPAVLYPSINSHMFDELLSRPPPKLAIPHYRYLFVSINRFEPKKNIALAVRTLRKLKTCLDDKEWSEVHLVVAGGYDPRLEESVKYLEKLKAIAEEQGVTDHITFMLSPKDAVKVHLISECTALLYTPSNEHFGIVPLEAMYVGRPVIAVDSGGPRETVVHEKTGFLCPAIESHFAATMARLIKDPRLVQRVGQAGKERFNEMFSYEKFSQNWQDCVHSLIHPDSINGKKYD